MLPSSVNSNKDPQLHTELVTNKLSKEVAHFRGKIHGAPSVQTLFFPKANLTDWPDRGGGENRVTREIARYAGVQPRSLPIG